MKKYLALGLLSSLLLTSCSVDWNDANVKKIGELEKQVTEISRKSSLDLQEKCSKKAKEYFGSQGFKEGATYENHYNNNSGKCFIKIHSGSYSKEDDSTSEYLSVTDVYEGKTYGSRVWQSKSSNESFFMMENNFDKDMKEFMEN